MARPLHGLVLAGGDSRRMQTDKALIDYHGQPQVRWAYEMISAFCDDAFVSVRRDQHDDVRDALPRIEDQAEELGPAAGLLAAAATHPDCGWLAIACDLPFVTENILENLVASRDEQCMATAYRSVEDRLPEPLCAIWEPQGLEFLRVQVEGGLLCPRKALILGETQVLEPISASALDNINTPDEHADAMGVIGQR